MYYSLCIVGAYYTPDITSFATLANGIDEPTQIIYKTIRLVHISSNSTILLALNMANNEIAFNCEWISALTSVGVCAQMWHLQYIGDNARRLIGINFDCHTEFEFEMKVFKIGGFKLKSIEKIYHF